MKKESYLSLERFVQNITEHIKWIVAFGVAFVVVGATFVYMELTSMQKEMAAQELFYEGEKLYLGLLKEQEQEGKAGAAGSKKAKTKDKDKGKGKAKTTKEAGKKTSSLDSLALSDHPDTKKAIELLKKVLSQYPSTSTAWLSALLLGDILRQQNKSKEALDLTQHLPWPKKTSRLFSLLALNQRGSLLADTGDCKGALDLWRRIKPEPLVSKDDKLSFFYQEVRLRMGLCYEKEKDWQNAKNVYESLVDEKKGAPSLQELAKKYLHILNFKLKEKQIQL